MTTTWRCFDCPATGTTDLEARKHMTTHPGHGTSTVVTP